MVGDDQGEQLGAAAESGNDHSTVRIDVLRRLVEQAMSDPAFRAAARDDLPGALAAYGYDLNERELALVTRFRATLAAAGIDLNLVESMDPVELANLLPLSELFQP